jgi:putative ABC transport system permease protein
MIGHWFTTAWRSLIGNPLFSAIAIISLSIGCCGALLAGANIKEHLLFERHIEDADRIFIVTRQQDQPFSGAPEFARAQRIEGTMLRPSTISPLPLKAAIAGIDGVEAQTRLVYAFALFQTDQDEIDRRNEAGPPAPGDPPRAPLPGTIFVDADFFKVFPMDFLEGSADMLQEPDTVIITKNRAQSLFGNEPAVGKTVEGVRGHSLRIIGVVPQQPANTHMVFQTMAGFRTLQMVSPQPTPPTFITDWNRFYSGYHYVKMKEGYNAETFAPAVSNAIKTAADIGMRQPTGDVLPGQVRVIPQYTWPLVPLLASHLAGPEVITFTFTAAASGDPKLIWTLAGGAIVLLIVSSFNYVNLSLARSLRRRREVAVRKVLGASRGQLVRQYLVESGMVTAISLVIGFIAAWFLAPWFARAIGQPEMLFNLFDPVFIAMALGLFTLLALTVGAYPAFYLAAVRPRTGLGEGGTASPGRIGQAVSAGLLGLQIASAACLLIIAGTMAVQANYIATRDMGYSIKDRFQVSLPCVINTENNPSQEQMAQLMRACNTGSRDLLERTPGIANAYFFSGQLLTESVTTTAFARSAAGEEIGHAARMPVDLTFLQNMGTTLLAGRYFDPNSGFDRAFPEYIQAMNTRLPGLPGAPPPDPSTMPKPPARVPVIVTASMMGPFGVSTPEELIGKELQFKPRQPAPFEIVGVIKDWHQRPLKFEVTPVVFAPQYPNGAIIELEDESKIANVQAHLRDQWRKTINNQRAQVTITSLEERLDAAYQTDFRLMWALVSFAGVAIVVAGMGVYGLSAFEMRRRVREIGIRKALGATPGKVAIMVIGRALAFAAIATLLAWPIGWWLAEQWLMGFVYRTELGLIVLPLATFAVIAFVAIAVSLNATRAAAIRPSTALRPN